ncbi:MAG: TetR family transcriptional regulator [Oscillospiraceae bacterium]|nr:TetR family transcriptional regulator [Oscillospiraceae bacterium]
MIKGSTELIAGRREEIINACEELYKTRSFKEITLKDIGNAVPFSRPTIYNYFQTKEEIFLALFEREYERWNEELTGILNCDGEVNLTEAIAGSLAKRGQLLKLLSMNNYDMEASSRQENLVSFKKAYGRSMELVSELLRKYRPEMGESERAGFIYMFFPFMFGIYPYTAVTDKQKTAMDDAGIDYVYQSAYELTLSFLNRLLSEKESSK